MPKNQENPESGDVLYGETEDREEEPVETSANKSKVKSPKVDVTIKRDVAFLQKKSAELEIAISDIQDKAQKLDFSDLESMRQRLEDIEDLTMVENAGIIELKKMLEGIQGQQPQMPEDLADRLKAVEEKVSAIPQMDTSQIDALKAEIVQLKADLESKMSDLKSYVPNVDLITSEIRREVSRSSEWVRSELNSQLEEKSLSLENQIAQMNEKLSTLPSPSELHATMDSISNSFKSFKSLMETKFQTEQNKMERRWVVIEDNVTSSGDLKRSIEEFKNEIEMKKDSIKLMVDSLEEKLKVPLPEKALEKLMKIRNDWNVNAARLDSMETMVKTFTKQLDSMAPTLKKLESFDKVIDFRNEVVRKFEDVRKMHESVEKIAKELNPLNVRKERAALESKLNMFNTSLAEIEDRTDRNDHDMSVFQGSLMTIEKSVNDLQNLIGRGKSTPSKEEELLKRLSDVEITVDAMKSVSGTDQISELISRLVFLESRLGAMETMMRNPPAGHYSAIIVE